MWRREELKRTDDAEAQENFFKRKMLCVANLACELQRSVKVDSASCPNRCCSMRRQPIVAREPSRRDCGGVPCWMAREMFNMIIVDLFGEEERLPPPRRR